MSPEQAIFTAVRQACIETGNDTYDYLPPDEVDYPFIFIGEQFGTGLRNNRDRRFNEVEQTIHVYHDNYRQRGTFSKVLEDIKDKVFQIKHVNGRRVTIESDMTRTIADQSTDIKLMHGVIEITFRIH